MLYIILTFVFVNFVRTKCHHHHPNQSHAQTAQAIHRILCSSFKSITIFLLLLIKSNLNNYYIKKLDVTEVYEKAKQNFEASSADYNMS